MLWHNVLVQTNLILPMELILDILDILADYPQTLYSCMFTCKLLGKKCEELVRKTGSITICSVPDLERFVQRVRESQEIEDRLRHLRLITKTDIPYDSAILQLVPRLKKVTRFKAFLPNPLVLHAFTARTLLQLNRLTQIELLNHIFPSFHGLIQFLSSQPNLNDLILKKVEWLGHHNYLPAVAGSRRPRFAKGPSLEHLTLQCIPNQLQPSPLLDWVLSTPTLQSLHSINVQNFGMEHAVYLFRILKAPPISQLRYLAVGWSRSRYPDVFPIVYVLGQFCINIVLIFSVILNSLSCWTLQIIYRFNIPDIYPRYPSLAFPSSTPLDHS